MGIVSPGWLQSAHRGPCPEPGYHLTQQKVGKVPARTWKDKGCHLLSNVDLLQHPGEEGKGQS